MRIITMFFAAFVLVSWLMTIRYFILFNEVEGRFKQEHDYASSMKNTAISYHDMWAQTQKDAEEWRNKYYEYDAQYRALYKKWLDKLDAYDAAKRYIKELTGKEWIYIQQEK